MLLLFKLVKVRKCVLGHISAPVLSKVSLSLFCLYVSIIVFFFYLYLQLSLFSRGFVCAPGVALIGQGQWPMRLHEDMGGQ